MNNTEIQETVRGMMRMSKQQLDYAIAKSSYDTHNAIKVSEADQAEYEKKFWKLLDSLLASEKALISWAKELMQTKRPSDYAKIAPCFEKPIYNDELRQKLINLCYRLDSSTMK